jgi:hypothetical protein
MSSLTPQRSGVMNRRNGNWLARSIDQRTATAATVRAALSGYRSTKPARAARWASVRLGTSLVKGRKQPIHRLAGSGGVSGDDGPEEEAAVRDNLDL